MKTIISSFEITGTAIFVLAVGVLMASRPDNCNAKPYTFPHNPDATVEIYSADYSGNGAPPEWHYWVQKKDEKWETAGYMQHDTRCGNVVIGQKGGAGEFYAKMLVLQPERPFDQLGVDIKDKRYYWKPKEIIRRDLYSWIKFIVLYPDLYKGDVAPMFNQFYRIVKFKHNPRKCVVVEKVPSKELPEGLKIQPDSFVILLGKQLGCPNFLFNKVDNDEGAAIISKGITPRSLDHPLTANIEIWYDKRAKKKEWHDSKYGKLFYAKVTRHVKHFKTAKIGDRLEHGGGAIIIRNIVPPNPKYKLIGYIEIGIEGLTKPVTKQKYRRAGSRLPSPLNNE